ncbi:MAG: MarR family winged helix-turn-helix transcriptional regulator [Sphingopyxis sp.]
MTQSLILSDFVPYQLSVASNAVSDLIARQYQARFGLKIAEWRLMAVLGQGEAMNQRALVHATRMDKVTVSRAAAALNERGLVERAASAHDGRSHSLSLSEAGRALYQEIAPAALVMEQAVLACLTLDERLSLSDMLVRLRDAADNLS